MRITGNSSSRHDVGDEARDALETSRRQLAALLDCAPGDVVFTGGGSGADALAVVGTVLAADRPAHVITTAIEHSAVLESCAMAAELGAEITVLRPDSSGWIDPDDVRRALRPDTVLVSVMHANNETRCLAAGVGDRRHRARGRCADAHPTRCRPRAR
ncbi:aminotransferase class V-fold PLP-dependent enzyme [Streptomyces thinghirensis]|nr:aminotransferase class V-fold PLP-dependent enzyme [Streptomyces thinghirensis]